MGELLTVDEVSQYLRVNKKTVYRLLKQGKIPATKVANQWRLDKYMIDQWLQRKSVGMLVNVLVVDDEAAIRDLFVAALAERQCEVVTAGNGHDGMRLIKARDFDMVFLDLKLPVVDGVELFREIRRTNPMLPVMIITGYPDSELMSRALAFGPLGLMKKPLGIAEIISAYDSILSGAGGTRVKTEARGSH